MKAQRAAVLVVFALIGAVLGSWAPRVPALAEHVRADPAALGMSLFGASAGVFVASSFSGRLVERAGVRATIGVFMVLAAVLLPFVGFAGSATALGAVLFLVGLAIGLVTIAANLAAVAFERRTGRPSMPLFHASASVGALLGSATAGLAAEYDIRPAQHFSLVGLVSVGLLAVVLSHVPGLGDLSAAPNSRRTGGAPPVHNPVLRRLATILLCAAVIEGAGAQWSALLLIEVHGVTDAGGAYAYAAFSMGMILARLSGVVWQRWWSASVILAAGGVLAGCGLVAAALLTPPLAGYLGFALAGIGCAGGFPLTLGLAGDQGRRADGGGGERELAFVGTVGYTGMAVGPPIIGLVAAQTSLSVSFLLVALLAFAIVPLTWGLSRSGTVVSVKP
ncbi:MFS transporter [Lentzea sp. NPDC004782]|uniref:MFS transporter n=1 Tax=Lentzea sp. NPDC004782 TaxID=3154458 RepID=UPI0033AB4EB2